MGQPVRPHLIPISSPSTLQGLQPSQVAWKDQVRPEKKDGKCWPLLVTCSLGQGRSWCLSPGSTVVRDSHSSWVQAIAMPTHTELSSRPSQLAVILGFHSQRAAVWGGRRESLSYFYLLAAKEEKPPQPSCSMQQERELRSLVSEPGKVIASLTPIPEKPLIYVSANFEALSNLDKL